MNYSTIDKPKRRLSVQLDHLLESCKSIESNSPNREEMNKNFKDFQKNLESLKVHKKTIIIEKTSNKIQDYINSKYSNTDTSFNNSVRLTHHLGTPAIFSDNKRRTRTKAKNSVKIENTIPSNREGFFKAFPERQNHRKQGLEELIQSFMKNKFGARQRFKENSGKVNRFNSVIIGNPDESIGSPLNKKSLSNYFVEENEKEYLAPEFKVWEKDTKNKLKLERIVKDHHQKERRQQMIGGINELKLIRYETMAIQYVNG